MLLLLWPLVLIAFAISSSPIDSAHRSKRAAANIAVQRWNSTVPFMFDDDFKDEELKAEVRKHLADIAAHSCLTFKETNGAAGPHLIYAPSGGCSSKIGVQGIKNYVFLADECRDGSISHETFHTLGLDHTATRKDRDQYIFVNYSNIIPAYAYNYDKMKASDNDNFGVPYDYGSLLHYGAYYFHNGKGPCIKTLDPAYSKAIGQSRAPAFSDYKMLNALYKCEATCPTKPACKNGGYVNSKKCGACICNDFFKGALCDIPVKKIVLSKQPNGKAFTEFKQAKNPSIDPENYWYNWSKYGKATPTIIEAPAGKKVRVTVERNQYNETTCYSTCMYNGVEIVDGDLSLGGRISCCSYETGSFVSKGNVIGFKAFVQPGAAYDVRVTYQVAN